MTGGGAPDYDALLSALARIVADPAEGEIRNALKLHPEILTAEGVALAEALTLVQQTREGRVAAEELALLVKLCAELGVDAGLEAHKVTVTEMRARQRVDDERDAARRVALQPVDPEEVPAWAHEIADQSVMSLHDCLSAMRDEPQPDAVARPVWSGEPQSLPAFMYRGESGLYRETRSSLARLARDPTMSARAFQEIMKITEAARLFLIENWRFTPLEASGFLQHYGLPTDWLDLTDDLAVAASFAGSLRVGQLGAMASLPTRRLAARGEVFDLSQRLIAARPRRQHAWVFSSPEHRDLKQPTAISALGIRWRLFRMTADDVAMYGVDPELLDAHSDPIAGVLHLLIDSGGWDPRRRTDRPRLDDDAARWLSARLEPAPLTGVVVPGGADAPSHLRLVSADEAGIPFDRDALRRRNYEAWSDQHEPAEVPEELRAQIEALVTHDLSGAAPGSAVQIVSGDGLRALAALDPE
jgi:hypothetical protein